MQNFVINALRHQRLVHVQMPSRVGDFNSDQRLTASKVSTLICWLVTPAEPGGDQRLTASKVSTPNFNLDGELPK